MWNVPFCKHAGTLLTDYLLRSIPVFDQIQPSQESYSAGNRLIGRQFGPLNYVFLSLGRGIILASFQA